MSFLAVPKRSDDLAQLLSLDTWQEVTELLELCSKEEIMALSLFFF
jgi:hypothetical protein